MSQMIKIGINGFGRIGRKVARLILERDDIEIVGINDLSKAEQMAHLFKNDSVHGRLKETVSLEGKTLKVISPYWFEIPDKRLPPQFG